jgi:hypothetical protein
VKGHVFLRLHYEIGRHADQRGKWIREVRKNSGSRTKASQSKPGSVAPGTLTFDRIRIIRFISS